MATADTWGAEVDGHSAHVAAGDRSGPSTVRPEARVRVSEHVVYREFPAQTVVLNLDTGRYHGLNPTGGRMLAALALVSRVADAACLIAGRYGQPRADVERELCELCARLLERGLIELDDGSGG